jgi:hypothetical protein
MMTTEYRIRDSLTRSGWTRTPVRVVHTYAVTPGEPDRVRTVVTYPHGHAFAGRVIRERWTVVPEWVRDMIVAAADEAREDSATLDGAASYVGDFRDGVTAETVAGGVRAHLLHVGGAS